MNKKNKKTTPFVFLAILVIVSTIFVIGNLFLRIKTASENYLNQKEELTVLRSKEKVLEGEDVVEVLSRKRELKNLFTDPERPIPEIIFLESRADNNNLDYTVSVGEKKTQNGWPYLEFQVDLSGDLDSALIFFEGLEAEKRVLFIDEVKFDFNQNNLREKEKEVNLSAKLGNYYLSEN